LAPEEELCSPNNYHIFFFLLPVIVL